MRSANPRSAGADPQADGAAEPGAPRRAGRARNPLRFVRRALLALFLILVAALAYAIVDRARQPAPPPLAALSADEGVAQRAINLEATRTRLGLPSLKVEAKEAFTFEEGRTELHDVAVTIFGESQGRTEVVAPLAVSEDDSAGSWSFRNGVEVLTESGVRLRVPELKYKESPPEVNGTGAVAFERGTISGTSHGVRYLVTRRRLDLPSEVHVEDSTPGSSLRIIDAESATFEPDASRITFHRYKASSETGQSLEGLDLRLFFEDDQSGASRIKKLEASGGFRSAAPRGNAAAPGGFLGSGAGSLSGDSMEIAFAVEGKPDEIRVEGSVKASLQEPDGSSRRLEARRLRIEFDASGRASRIRAEEKAMLDAPGGGSAGAGSVLRAEVIDSTLDPNSGALSLLKATGDASIEEGERRLRAPAIRYEAATDFWFLDGQEGAPARAAGYGMTISSRKIEIHRLERRLEASGDVKTTAEPKSKPAAPGPQPAGAAPDEPAGTFFGGNGPVHGMSESLRVEEGGKRAFYRGGVRLWREGTSIEAAEVDLDQESGAIEARGSVVARIPSKGGAAQEGRTITISSSRMNYDRALGKAHFTGSSRAVAGDMRIESETLEIRGASEGGAKEMTARGGVKLVQGTRTGSCDELFADLAAEKYILYGRGRLATIQDKSSQQVAKGTVLTFEGSADKILVESETGGRTWITLAPRPGMGKKSDPESPR